FGNKVYLFIILPEPGKQRISYWIIDSKFNYGLALSISNAVEDLNAKLCENRPDAEIFWTMRNEGKPGEDYPVVEDIIAKSLKFQDDARINEIRKDKELRVMVEGWHTCVDDDGYSTYNAEIEFEIGEGANTIQEALALVEKFHKETVETNQNHYDGYDPLPGYYSPRLFTVYNPIGDPLFAGFWQYDKQVYFVPEPLTDAEYHELHDKKARLNKELPENQRADNYDTCRQIRDEIVQIELKLVTSDFWTTVNDFPGDAVIGDFTESVKKFNAQSATPLAPDRLTELQLSSGHLSGISPTLHSANIKELFQPITALNEDTPASGTSIMEEEVMEADSG
ncbi:hypothetical protein JJP99_25440, partial [Enterobacter hormaechei]|nr:hypothetical protein [Enterobacter hormaechei]